jgi:alpha-L-fucosidase
MKQLRNQLLLTIFTFVIFSVNAQEKVLNLNKPEREQWFTELGFGMFIHWSVDVQYGYNISHTMRMASEDYLNRYINELPKTFNPADFNPTKWAKLAKMTGMKYMVFTTKHHNGFCMWDTKTTNFGIMNTPFKRDITKEIFDAFRKEGIAIGVYYSPDDFWFLHKQGTYITRNHPSSKASSNPELNTYDKTQLRELLTRYGKIDILFLDGEDQYGKTELAKVGWEINPNIVVTRGVMKSPEQELPKEAMPSPWEACYTTSQSWSYRPTNEVYKTAAEVISKWVEIRAKGGNLVLNVGPDANGVLAPKEEGILNEVGSWWFINHEMFENTKPFEKVQSDNGCFFLQSKNGKDLYIMVPGYVKPRTWLNLEIEGLKAGKKAEVSLLGQGVYTNEKQLQDSKKMSVKNTEKGVSIDYIFLQILYNTYLVDNKWNNPIVLKITDYKD